MAKMELNARGIINVKRCKIFELSTTEQPSVIDRLDELETPVRP